MRQIDLVFYQNLIQVLVPDVLKPIPATLTQSIRNFAKSKFFLNLIKHQLCVINVDLVKLKPAAVSHKSTRMCTP